MYYKIQQDFSLGGNFITENAQFYIINITSGPFHQAVSSVMTLTNPSERKVCFKIRTTAPRRYRVVPNSGVIDPMQTVQVAGN